MHVVKELQGRLYCEETPLTEEEQREGVDAADELEAWAAMCGERQAAAPGVGSANTAAGGLQLLLTDARDREEEEEEEEWDREDVSQQEEEEEERVERRRRRRRQSQLSSGEGGTRSRERPWVRQERGGRALPVTPQGGQRAAAAVAAAYVTYAGSQQQSWQPSQQQSQQQQSQQPWQQPSQRQSQQQQSQQPSQRPSQQQQQQESQAHSRSACFKCGDEGHWAADCPQGSARRGNCFKVGTTGQGRRLLLCGNMHPAPGRAALLLA